MVAALDGIIFYQFYGDNSGGAEYDTDGDGTATQEDEFVTIQNTSGVPVDISGWEIWSDMTGAGAPDGMQDGLYHTFPPGTVIEPGKSLMIVNEITGTPAYNMQEASEGGLESGAGGVNTNFLSEGASGQPESVALVNPATGEYIVLNLSDTEPENVSGQSGFTGTTKVAESNAATDSGQADQEAGSYYIYNSSTGQYEYQAFSVTCFAEGTRIAVPDGMARIETLSPGDLVETLDHGAQAIRTVLKRQINFADGARACHKPIEIKTGALGGGRPKRSLIVSPQHRILVETKECGRVLVPAKGLLGQRGVRRMLGRHAITYLHLVLDQHEIIKAEGSWSESFYPGEYTLLGLSVRAKVDVLGIYPEVARGSYPPPARPGLRVSEVRRWAMDRPLA